MKTIPTCLRLAFGLVLLHVGLVWGADIYFLDQNGSGQRLWKVNPATGAQSVLASGGSLAWFYNGQGDLAVDASGRILVTFMGATKGIVRVDPATGAQTVVVSDNLFNTPSSICVGKNYPPTVSNVRATQRPGTMLVDIYYDSADSDSAQLTVSIVVSTNGGAPGTGRKAVWNAGSDLPAKLFTNLRVRVTASDEP